MNYLHKHINRYVNEVLRKSRLNFLGENNIPSSMKDLIGLSKVMLGLREKHFHAH